MLCCIMRINISRETALYRNHHLIYFLGNSVGPKKFLDPPRLGDPTVYHRTTRKTQLRLNDLCPILKHGGRLPPCLIGSTMTTDSCHPISEGNTSRT